MTTKIEERPVNISTVAHFFDLDPQTLNLWYKHQFSNYRKAKQEGSFMGQKVEITDKETGEIVKESDIYICKAQNIGNQMCIDEKMLGKQYYTILSNPDTGKIAYLIGSMNPEVISDGLQKLGIENLSKIRRINSDMSPTMKKLCSDNFENAKIVVDKFHVIKHLLDALNSVRLDIKKQIKEIDQLNESNPNSWSDLECLEKCRYLLYKMRDELSQEQEQLLSQILEKYPTLNEAYNITQKIRKWYARENIGKHVWYLKRTLDLCMIDLEKTKIKAFNVIRKMFIKHENDIIRYFESGATNAKAENLNARLQRFLANNFGIKDKDFFFFRTQIYFS